MIYVRLAIAAALSINARLRIELQDNVVEFCLCCMPKTELDEASWLGMEEAGFAKAEGGTLNACNVATGACSVVASSLALPTAIAVDKSGGVWIAEQETMLFAGSLVRRLQ